MMLGDGGATVPAADGDGGPRALPGVSAHARLRCIQHHGVDLCDAEWLEAWLDIVEGRAVLVRMLPEARTIYGLPYRLPGGRPLLLGYKPLGACIATTLPSRAALQHRPRRYR